MQLQSTWHLRFRIFYKAYIFLFPKIPGGILLRNFRNFYIPCNEDQQKEKEMSDKPYTLSDLMTDLLLQPRLSPNTPVIFEHADNGVVKESHSVDEIEFRNGFVVLKSIDPF